MTEPPWNAGAMARSPIVSWGQDEAVRAPPHDNHSGHPKPAGIFPRCGFRAASSSRGRAALGVMGSALMPRHNDELKPTAAVSGKQRPIGDTANTQALALGRAAA